MMLGNQIDDRMRKMFLSCGCDAVRDMVLYDLHAFPRTDPVMRVPFFLVFHEIFGLKSLSDVVVQGGNSQKKRVRADCLGGPFAEGADGNIGGAERQYSGCERTVCKRNIAGVKEDNYSNR